MSLACGGGQAAQADDHRGIAAGLTGKGAAA